MGRRRPGSSGSGASRPDRDIRAWPGCRRSRRRSAMPPSGSSRPAFSRRFRTCGASSRSAPGVDHVFADPDLPGRADRARRRSPTSPARMSEWVVLHALMHLRRQRLYDAFQRAAAVERRQPAPAARDVAGRHHGHGRARPGRGRGSSPRIGFDVAGWSRTRSATSRASRPCRRGRARRLPGAHRPPRRACCR